MRKITFFSKTSFLLFLFLIQCTVVVRGNRPNVINFEPNIYHGANKNWSIASDENGILYVGNDRGLIEFDGVQWNLYKLPSKGIVRSVGVANSHHLFTGGTEEFGEWTRGTSGQLNYQSLSAKINFKELKNSDFWRIFVTREGVYFQSFSSIFFYNYKTVRKLASTEAPILLVNKVRSELLYQKMKNGIYILKGDKASLLTGSNMFKNTDVRVILPYGKSGYLFATNSKGLIVYENGEYRDLNPKLSALLNKKDVNVGVLSPRGTYLLGTLLDGMYEIDKQGNILNHLSSDNALQNKSVLSIAQDGNNVWLGMDKGISYVSYNENLNYYTNTFDNIGAIYAACFWKNNLLIGTNQGVFSVPQSELHSYSASTNHHLIKGTEGQVWNLKVIDGKLYCCHNNGLYVIGEDFSVKQIYDIGTGVYNIDKAHIGNTDFLMLSTYHSLVLIDLKSQQIIHPEGINEPIYDAKTDHLGNFWLEHPNRGVYRCQWNPGDASFQNIHYYGGNASRILPSKLNLFKAGGRINLLGDDTVYLYNDIADRIEVNTTLNRLFAKVEPIRKIFSCNSNQYIALSENTFHLFSYDGYKAAILSSHYIGANLNFVDNYETIIPLNDSISLFALDDGFILYQLPRKGTQEMNHLKLNSPLVTLFKAFNREKLTKFENIGKKPSVSYDFNTIKINFNTKNAFSDHIQTQYILEGVDMDWSPKSFNNQVTYERLPAGTYTFKMRAIDVGGNFSAISTFRFTVKPPWYNSWWAYLIYFLLIAGILYAGRLYILFRYRKQHVRKLRKLETMRLQMLADELQNEVNKKNAELVTQTSFIIQKNELIEKIRTLIDDFCQRNKSSVIQQLTQKINALLSNNLDTEEDWKNFLIKFEEKHTDFFKRLKAEYPDLTSSDLRLCACLKLNMGTKDIASLMNLSIRAIENNRYRLRKKLNLKTEENLNDFFISLD